MTCNTDKHWPYNCWPTDSCGHSSSFLALVIPGLMLLLLTLSPANGRMVRVVSFLCSLFLSVGSFFIVKNELLGCDTADCGEVRYCCGVILACSLIGTALWTLRIVVASKSTPPRLLLLWLWRGIRIGGTVSVAPILVMGVNTILDATGSSNWKERIHYRDNIGFGLIGTGLSIFLCMLVFSHSRRGREMSHVPNNAARC